MSAAAKYAQEDGGGDVDRPLKVCAEAGRKCVRNINQYPILSPDWISLVDSLKQLTRLVQLEAKMPVNAKVAEAHGRNADSQGTLWDQETHENAIRILVEEAKVNLCLRMMNDFKRWQYDPAEKQMTITAAMRENDYSESTLDQKTRQFEESMGTLLMRAFLHVETLQLMDIPLLIEHCALVLGHCAHFRSERLDCTAKEQELLIMSYVASLFTHAEALNNSELLAKALEFSLLSFSVHHVLAHAQSDYPPEIVHEVAHGYAALCDNEDFKTNWKQFFDDGGGQLDRDQMARFLQLKTELVEGILRQYPDKRSSLRPLTDFFALLERTMR